MAPNLLPISTVAARLNCSIKSVTGYARKGTLLGVKVGGRWKFDPREVDRYIARQTQRPAQRLERDVPAARRRAIRGPGEAELQLPGASTFL